MRLLCLRKYLKTPYFWDFFEKCITECITVIDFFCTTSARTTFLLHSIMQKLLLILICLFVSFEVKSDDEKLYLEFKKNEKQFYEKLVIGIEITISFSKKNELEDFISESIQDEEIEDFEKIKLKKRYSGMEKKKIIEILKEKIFEEPRVYFAQFKGKNYEFVLQLEKDIKLGFEEYANDKMRLEEDTFDYLKKESIKVYNREKKSLDEIKLIGDFSESQKRYISKTLVSDFFKQRKKEKKYYACVSKYSKGEMDSYELGIIGESCEMKLSGDKKRQKRGKCNLKEVGKHSREVLAIKYTNCMYQNE